MGLFSRLFGIEKSVEATIKKTLQESFPYLPGTPANGTLDFQRPDQDGFLPVGYFRKRSKRGDNPQAYLHEEQLREAVETSRHLSVSNEYARNGLTNRRNYIVGTGFKTIAEAVDPDSPNDALIKQTNEWLQRYAVLTKRCEKEKEAVMRGDRDGEVFIRLAGKGDVMQFRFVEPEHVGDWDGETPFGIKTDPDDITNVKAYLVRAEPGEKYETVPAEEMIHVKLNSDSGIKRGLPFLYPVFSILRKIESTNENMATNVAIMASIAMIRRRQFQLKSAVDTQNAARADYSTTRMTPGGGTDNYKTYRAGTILDVDGDTEYEFPANSINLGGVVNVKQSLLQTAAAGMGLPEYMLTSDASNSNMASTQVAETPAVAGFLAMQHFWGEAFGSGMYVEGADLGLTWRAIQRAVEAGQLPEEVLEEISLKVEGPNIEVRDKAQETDRNLKLADAGIISRDHVAAKEGHAKAHKSDDEVQAQKDKELAATQSHEMKMASARGVSRGIKEEFDEDKHPRDGDGKFASKGGEGENGQKKDTDSLHHEIADHFKIPVAAVRDTLKTDFKELQRRDDDNAPNHAGNGPYKDYENHKLGTVRAASWQSDPKEAYIDYLTEHNPSDLVTSEPEDGIKQRDVSYPKYVEWAKAGHEPPPISTSKSSKEGSPIVSSNRRRVLAAKEAGVKKIKAWHSAENPHTGNPLKYGDIIEHAKKLGLNP